jgi:hypothetical protein
MHVRIRNAWTISRAHTHTHTHAHAQITLDGLALAESYPDFKREEPCTMLLFDFFLHDTQHSLPLLGVAPEGHLHREMEVMVDSLFLSETSSHDYVMLLFEIHLCCILSCEYIRIQDYKYTENTFIHAS